MTTDPRRPRCSAYLATSLDGYIFTSMEGDLRVRDTYGSKVTVEPDGLPNDGVSADAAARTDQGATRICAPAR